MKASRIVDHNFISSPAHQNAALACGNTRSAITWWLVHEVAGETRCKTQKTCKMQERQDKGTYTIIIMVPPCELVYFATMILIIDIVIAVRMSTQTHCHTNMFETPCSNPFDRHHRTRASLPIAADGHLETTPAWKRQ
jgi:hypothetical protein